MSFLAPLATSLAGSAGSSLLGSLMGNVGPTAAQKQVLDQNAEAQSIGLNSGRNLIGMGTQAVQKPLDYWGSILSGNRGMMTSALAPEISQIGQGYSQANKTSAALMPRGGPSAEVQGQMPFQQQRDVSSLFQQARPAAAGALGNLGGSILGQGANALYASTAAGRDILTQQQQMQDANRLRGSSIGAGLFSQFQQYGIPALKKHYPNLFNMQGSTSESDFGTMGSSGTRVT